MNAATEIGGEQKRVYNKFHKNETDSQVTIRFLIYRGYQRPTKPVPGDCGYYLHAHQVVLSHPTTNQVSLGMCVKISCCLRIQKGTCNCQFREYAF